MSNKTHINHDRVILGIDPGTIIMGYGIVHVKSKKAQLTTMGVLKLDKFADHSTRLKKIFERTLALIDEYHPDELAIEAPFFGKNVQSMLKLGRAQGVAIAAALYRQVPIYEYSPKKIKMAITGSGSASKEQVAAMLYSILDIKAFDGPLDATDGLAAAMCHYFQNNLSTGGKTYSGWKSFLSDNPDRIK